MGSTAVLALPYPESADPADVPLDMQQLAEAIEASRKLRPQGVGALPSSPTDGDECYYVADATYGVVWHLRYRSASASSYKWEFIGGAALFNEAAAQVSTASTTYVDLGGATPTITVPLAGDYDIGIYARGWNNTASQYGLAAAKIGAAASADADGVMSQMAAGGASQTLQLARVMRRTVSAAASVVKLQYRASGGTALWDSRGLRIEPVRVG